MILIELEILTVNTTYHDIFIYYMTCFMLYVKKLCDKSGFISVYLVTRLQHFQLQNILLQQEDDVISFFSWANSDINYRVRLCLFLLVGFLHLRNITRICMKMNIVIE